MTTDQKRVCRIGELPVRFTSHDGSRVNNPRRAMALVTTEERSSTTTTTTTTTTTNPPKRAPGKLLRRETTSRLLDLSNPPTSSNILRATTSEPGGSSLLGKGPHSKSTKTPWKSSKFFSRTMTSADLLKGIKKLSIPSAEGDQPPTFVSETTKSEAKATFKARLSSLRRKSSSGNALLGSLATVSAGTNPSDVVIKVDREPDKRRESLAEFQGSLTPPRKKSEDEGIVCKREDLISLINKVASKQKSVPISPKSRRTPLRVTRSASFEPKKGVDSDSPDSNNSSQETSRRSSLEKNFELKEHATLSLSKGTSPTSRSPLSKTSPVRIEELPSQEDIANVEEEDKFVDIKKSLLEETVSLSSTDTTEEKSTDDEPPHEAAKVQWDDGTDVNAMLLGGAIEAFLKGMGGPAVTTEKRVSFKKN